MGLKKDVVADITQASYDSIAERELRPRVRMALRMYALAAVPTLSAAAEATGLALGYLSLMANSPAGKEYMQTVQQILDEKAISTTDLINKLGRRAIEIIGGLAEDGSSPSIQLKAAIDLADRSPETSKTTKVQVDSFSLSGKDARLLAESIVQGRSVHERFGTEVLGNVDRVTNALPSGNPEDIARRDTIESPKGEEPV